MHIMGFPMFALLVEPEVQVEPARFDSKNPEVGLQPQDLGTWPWILAVLSWIEPDESRLLRRSMSTYIGSRMGWFVCRYSHLSVLFWHISRRWNFHISAAITGSLTILLCTIKESRPSVLLNREVVILRKITGIETLKAHKSGYMPNLSNFIRFSVFLPAKILSIEPLAFTLAMASSIASALLYLLADTLPTVYRLFGFSEEQASLPFIAIMLGVLPGILTRFLDHRVREKHRREGNLLPEHKLTGFMIAAPIYAGAIWLFAWTIPQRVVDVHWMVSVVALFMVGYGTTEFLINMRVYLIDCYSEYASSATGSITIARCLVSSALALCGDRMFGVLGTNISMTIIGAVAAVLSAILYLLPRYGERVRKRSKFAQDNLEISRDGKM